GGGLSIVSSESANLVQRQVAEPKPAAAMRRSRRVHMAGAISVLVGLLLWELISRFVVNNALFLAAPSQIVGALWEMMVSGEIWRHVGISAAEFFLGYAIASVLGVGTGLAMANSAVSKR